VLCIRHGFFVQISDFKCSSCLFHYNRTAVAYGTVSFFSTIAVASFKVEPKLLYRTSRSLNIKCVTFLRKELLSLLCRKGCILNCNFFLGEMQCQLYKISLYPKAFFLCLLLQLHMQYKIHRRCLCLNIKLFFNLHSILKNGKI